MKQFEYPAKHSQNAVIMTKRQFRKSLKQAAKQSEAKLKALVEKYNG